MKSPIHAVVLAAGKGTRLGYPKAALVVQDQWMLPILMKALRLGGATRITLVTTSVSSFTFFLADDPRALSVPPGAPGALVPRLARLIVPSSNF